MKFLFSSSKLSSPLSSKSSLSNFNLHSYLQRIKPYIYQLARSVKVFTHAVRFVALFFLHFFFKRLFSTHVRVRKNSVSSEVTFRPQKEHIQPVRAQDVETSSHGCKLGGVSYSFWLHPNTCNFILLVSKKWWGVRLLDRHLIIVKWVLCVSKPSTV